MSYPRGRTGGGGVRVISKGIVIALLLCVLAAASARAQNAAGEAAFRVYVIDERLTRAVPDQLLHEILTHLPAHALSLCGWQFHGCKKPIPTQDRSEANRTAILRQIEATLSRWAEEPYSARESRPILEVLALATGNAVRDFNVYADEEKIDKRFDDESRTGYHITLITRSDILLHAGASGTLAGRDIPDGCFGKLGGPAPEFPSQALPPRATASMDVVMADAAPETLPPNALRALLVALGWIDPVTTPFGGQKALGCASSAMAPDLFKHFEADGHCRPDIPIVTAPRAPLLCRDKPTEPTPLSQTATAIASPPQPDPPLSRSIIPNPDHTPPAAPAAFGGMLVVASAAAPGSDLPLEITGDWQDGKARTRLLLAGPGAPGTILAAGSGSLLAVAESYHLVLAATAPPGLYTLLIQTRPAPDPCDAAPLSRGKIAVRGGKVAAKDIQIERSITLCGGNTPVTERILDIEVR